MDLEQKKKILKAINLGVSKLELIDAFNFEKNNIKDLIDFYDNAVKIKKSIESGNDFLSELYKDEISEEDYALMQTMFKKNKPVFVKSKKPFFNFKNFFKKISSIILILIFLLAFFLVLIQFVPIDGVFDLKLPELNFDLNDFFAGNNQNEIIVSGIFLGESTNFSDTKITVTGSLIKSIKLTDNNYLLKINCDEDFIINFSKEGFVPLHKKINFCENQKIDIVMAKMNDFQKINLTTQNLVSSKGVKIELDGNDLVIQGINASPKNAELSITGFDPNSLEDMKYFPGTTKGFDENNNKKSIIVYGFAKILLQNESGQNLDFKTENAKISFLISDTQKDLAPKEAILWNFDETSGAWFQVNEANKICDQMNCYYEANLKKIGSWYSVGEAVAPTTTLFMSGFDYMAPNNRVDSASAPYQRPITSPPKINPGEKVVDLPQVKTNMVCEYDRLTKMTRIENYNKKSLAEVKVEEEAGFMLWTTTKTDYFGKGVMQVVQDDKGNTIRELETECVCRETKTSTNRNIIACDGYNAGVYYDNCIRTGVEFSCAKINCANPCQDFETFKRCNSDFEKFYDAVTDFENKVFEETGQYPTAFDFWRTWASYDGDLVSEGATALRGYRVWDSPVKGKFFDKGNFDEVRKTYAIIFMQSGIADSKKGQSLGVDLKIFNVNGEVINMDHVAVGVTTKEHVPSMSIQNFVDIADTTVGQVPIAVLKYYYGSDISFKQNLNPQNYNGNLYGALLASDRDEWENKKPSEFFKENFFNLTCNKKEGFMDNILRVGSFGGLAHRIMPTLLESIHKRLTTPPYVNYLNGLFIFKPNGISLVHPLEGVDLFSGRYYQQVTDFVYLTNIPLFQKEFSEELFVYDYVLSNYNGDYFIVGPDGIHLVDANLLNINQTEIIYQKNNFLFKFSKMAENLFFITSVNINLEGKEYSIDYDYEGVLLKNINYNTGERITFNYNSNKIKNITYNTLTEIHSNEFEYVGNNILKITYKIGNNEIMQTSYLINETNLLISNDFQEKKFNLENGITKNIEYTYNQNDQNLNALIEFEYDQDYTYVTIDKNYTTTCFKGICFIDEIAVSQTTAQKCLDYYPLNLEVKDFDEFSFVVHEETVGGSKSLIEYNIDKKNIEKLNEIELSQNSEINIFLKLNGVLSNPIKIITTNEDAINITSLLTKPKNCTNSRISFGGFSIENCKFYSMDQNKLVDCLFGANAMFNSSKEEILSFLNNLDLNYELKQEVIDVITKRFLN